MEHFDYSLVPSGFGHCAAACPKAATCLRRIAYDCLPADKTFIHMLSPRVAEAVQGEGCPHYLSSAKQRYAGGFTKLIEGLTVRQAAAFRERMTALLGRKNYYLARRGDRLLSPAEQQQVRSLLRKLGVEPAECFDCYADCFVWH